MKLITWNVRGMNKLYKQKEIKVFISKNKIKMIATVEHRVKEQNAGQIIKKIVPGWSWHDNYNSNTRWRIWILWDHNVVDYTPLQVYMGW